MGNSEIGKYIDVNGIKTNYHDYGTGNAVLLLHGSGPGVSAWANWRFNILDIGKENRVIAPDIVGFGFTQHLKNIQYSIDFWIKHIISFLDILEIERVSIIGNSFGGALALAIAIRYPKKVDKLILMGSVGLKFKITEGLDKVWGYTPSIDNMRELLDLFAYDRTLVTDELAKLRYNASIREGIQESFSSMFPSPRQRWIDLMSQPQKKISLLENQTLIIHGREDKIIPKENSIKLSNLIHNAELHIFGRCGHWTQIEHKDAFNRLVTNFLI
ncbi:MAG: 2-hydroxy-6-oxo-2,4-heptadienoate hydrolase [Candidatus Marinimicrobia bacterium]|nr:2-hydroxy-6-oxo-2,4-heptadienoate hydrolase [Candidatus Neomarinimicrobiota bacterium]|tara:strand:- start:5454 stop:6269 length:816 start_codon:yes stop_codon:yes gene_type:complete